MGSWIHVVKDQLYVVYVCVIILSSVCHILYLQLNVRVLREVMPCFETGIKCGFMFVVLYNTP
jgi:hypothetical protein